MSLTLLCPVSPSLTLTDGQSHIFLVTPGHQAIWAAYSVQNKLNVFEHGDHDHNLKQNLDTKVFEQSGATK